MFRSFFKKAMERMQTQGYRRAVQTCHLKKRHNSVFSGKQKQNFLVY